MLERVEREVNGVSKRGTHSCWRCMLAIAHRRALRRRRKHDSTSQVGVEGAGADGPVDARRRLHRRAGVARQGRLRGQLPVVSHAAVAHRARRSHKWWRGKPLSDLFTFVSTRMPKNDPGSLAPEDVADVMAYLLKMNAMPVGPSRAAARRRLAEEVRIEVEDAEQHSSTAKRTKP